MATQEGTLPPAAQDAIQHAVAKADPKKTPESPLTRFLKNLRGGK